MADFWQLPRVTFQTTGATLRMTSKVMRGAFKAGQYAAARGAMQRSLRAAGRGVLGPGDGPPPPGCDVLDYRGLTPTGQLKLVTQGLPLGQLVDVHSGILGRVELPLEVVLRHSCVIGPSGAGKTRSIMAPWIAALLASGISVVTIDVKGDLLQEISAHVARMGGSRLGVTGRIWDYSSHRSHRWNFLHEMMGERSVEAAVVSLLGRQKENDPQPYFYQRDYRWLKGLLKLAVETHGSAAEPRHVLEALTDQDRLRRLVPLSTAGIELRDLESLDPGDYARDVSGLLNVLSIFRQSNVMRSVSTSDFRLEDVTNEPTLLIAVARLSDGRLGEQMSSLLVSQFTLAILERFGRAMPRPVVLVLDEAPRLRQRIDLEETISIARGAGAGVCLAAQDVTQFGTPEQQSTLFANCHTFISMYGASPHTADYLGKRLGSRHKEEISVTTPGKRGFLELPSTSRQLTVSPVLGPREIMFPPFGKYSAVVHCPSVSSGPFIVDLEQV